MKPQDFVKEFVRMCEYYKHTNIDDDCKACPMLEKSCWSEDIMDMNHPEKFAEAYNIVAKWSDEHPAKTKSDEFLKLHPDAMINADGVVAIPSCFIEKNFKDGNICENFGNNCDECTRQYWSKGVDD